ncbi:MAG: hypothetical protein ACOYOU_15445 [Kiritimatiellia bacterium]
MLRVVPQWLSSQHLRTRLRSWVVEGKSLARAGFGLTAREREGVMLVAALFALGLAVEWLRWLLGTCRI